MKNWEKEFFNKLADKLEKLFPKQKCKERSSALVLNAFANIYFKEGLDKQKKEIREMIKKMKRGLVENEAEQWKIHYHGYDEAIDDILNKLNK